MYNYLTAIFLLLVNIAWCQSHVKLKTWYDAKKTIIKEDYYALRKSPSVLDSSYFSYFQNGQLKSKGQFRMSKPIGTWEYYYENGNIKMKGEIKDNESNGTWTYYYENGNIDMQGELKKNVKQGDWTYFFENGKLKSAGKFEDGKKEGSWAYYYEDEALKADADFHNDKGKYTEYFTDGKIKSEGIIENGKSNGYWKYYYETDTLKAEGIEKNGLKEGHWKFYYENGKLSGEGDYSKGKKEGKWTYYHDNGVISSEGDERDDQKNGYWKIYYNDGKFKGEGNFNRGEGMYKEYYESGKLKLEGMVKGEKNEGQWNYYYENGAKEGQCFYNNGKGHYTGYYENGKKKMEGMIDNGNKVGIWTLYKEDGELAGYYKTYYENNTPVFKKEEKTDSTKKDSVAPRATPRFYTTKKRSRFYTQRINEFYGIIVSVDPIALLRSSFPVYAEYYFQERLGYEFNYTFYRSPLLSGFGDVNNQYYQGFSTYLRQKLYQKDREKGMFYFAQEVRFTLMDYLVNYQDQPGDAVEPTRLKETRYEVSGLIGNRLLKSSHAPGWTIDAFIGLGVGYRYVSKDPTATPAANSYFSVTKSGITVPLRLGVTFGYLF